LETLLKPEQSQERAHSHVQYAEQKTNVFGILKVYTNKTA